MPNLYKSLRALFPDPPLQVGEVVDYGNGEALVQLPGGGNITARGQAMIGDRVFVRDGVIEGQAPTLTIELIDI